MMPHGALVAGPRIEGCCALIAVKQRVACKSRLRTALTPAAHLSLVRSMLDHVLSAARGAGSVRQIIVLTPERDTLPADVPVLADTGAGLNLALADAHRALLGLGVGELLVLPADLPHVTAGEIDQLIDAGRRGGCAIAPDLAGVGTNALYVRTREAFDFRFGSDSLKQHLIESRRLGLAAQQLRLPGLAFDVDRPCDLDRMELKREASCVLQ
jgi:2-phospho-L-lactate guanylyltransferase